MQAISVEPNFTLKIDTGGNRHDVIYMDINGVRLSHYVMPEIVGETYRLSVVPAGAYEARIIVSSEGAVWDALGYTPTVSYDFTASKYMNQQLVNKNLNIKMNIVASKYLLDSNGSTGSNGQVLTSDGNGGAFWL